MRASFSQGRVKHGDATPVAHTILSDDEVLAPERLDFEGASGVFDHQEAPCAAADLSDTDKALHIGRRLFGKQRVQPPRSRSRSVASEDPGDVSEGSSFSADSCKMLTKNQKKKIREKAESQKD